MSYTYRSRIAQLLEQKKITEKQANMQEADTWCPISDKVISELFPGQDVDQVVDGLTDQDLIDAHAEVQKRLEKKKKTLRYLEQEGKGDRADAQQLREEIRVAEQAQAK